MTARRPRGDGSVFYDAARRCWVAVIELPRDPATGRRIRRKVSAPTKTAARAALDGLRAEKRRAGTVARRDATVGSVLDAYLARPPASWESPITVAVNTGHAKRIKAALGRVKIATLTPSQVEAFLDGMAAGGYAASTITGTRRLLTAAIRRAERDGLAGRNAAALAERAPRGKRAQPRMLTREQITALFAAADADPWWAAYVHVAVTLGLRPGELLGLRWADVDLDAPRLSVRGEHLKTPQSRRTLTMPARTAAALRAHRAAQRQTRLAAGPAWREHDLVFPRADGSPAARRTVSRSFAALCERAGLGPGWTRYATRHTFATHASHGGLLIEDIADAMGHANSRVTQVVYRHALADEIAGAATVFDAMLDAPAPGA